MPTRSVVFECNHCGDTWATIEEAKRCEEECRREAFREIVRNEWNTITEYAPPSLPDRATADAFFAELRTLLEKYGHAVPKGDPK